MRVLLSTYGSRGDVEPMVELAVRLRALGAEVRAAGDRDDAADGGPAPARPSWSARSSTRSPWRPRDVMRWSRLA